ncbi:unnamed protein product [Leuciscus chuanchicus]
MTQAHLPFLAHLFLSVWLHGSPPAACGEHMIALAPAHLHSPLSRLPPRLRRFATASFDGPRRILIAVSIVTLCVFIKPVQSLPLLLCAVCSMQMTCHSLQGTHAWIPNMVRLKRVSLYTTKNMLGMLEMHTHTYKHSSALWGDIRVAGGAVRFSRAYTHLLVTSNPPSRAAAARRRLGNGPSASQACVRLYDRMMEENSREHLDTDNEAGGEDALVGNVNKLMITPPGYTGPPKKGHVIFDACFESGNLGRVDYISEFEFDLFIRPDTCNPRFRVWFNFTVENVRETQRVIFNIVNFSKTKSLYRDGMSPVVKSTSRPKWQRLPAKNVYYYRCPDHRRNYVMSFAFCFDREDDVYQFAYCYPYTYSRLQHYLASLERRNLDYLQREQLGLSVQQRRLDLLTITNPGEYACFALCACVFVIHCTLHHTTTLHSQTGLCVQRGHHTFVTSLTSHDKPQLHPKSKNLQKKRPFLAISFLSISVIPS